VIAGAALLVKQWVHPEDAATHARPGEAARMH
jgi:hypothetical protein